MNHYKIVFQPVQELPDVIVDMDRARFTRREYQVLLSWTRYLVSERPLKDYYVYILKNERLIEELRISNWTNEFTIIRVLPSRGTIGYFKTARFLQ